MCFLLLLQVVGVAYDLNFARGDLVNDDDIIEALSRGKVASYVTDFPNDNLIGVDGVIAIPHLGASTPESEDNCARMAAQELSDFLENGNIRNSVNFPNVEAPRSTACRICIIHRNVPNMIAQISSIISGMGINIDTLTNKSKKDFAYTLIDVDDADEDETFSAIRGIEGIIRVRVIK